MLNGTFLVQAIHFFIAYIIIERLLFRPALREINADRLEKAQLQEVVDAQTQRVQQLQEEQDALRIATQQELLDIQPSLLSPVHQPAAQELPELPHLLPHDKARLIEESVAKVIKEVEHA